MWNPSIKHSSHVLRLIFLCCLATIVVSCATQTGTKTDTGALSTSERLSRIKATGTSKEQQEQSDSDEDSDEDDNTELSYIKRTPVAAPKEVYIPEKSNYQLPKPIKRTHPKVEVGRDTQSEYRDALKALEKGIQTKNFTDALARFESMTGKYPQLSGPQTNIGMIYMHQKKFEDAEAAFQKALQINPENEFALNNLGLCYRELGKFPEAKQSYLKATALEPGYAEAHYNLGVLADLYLRDVELAIESFEYYRLSNRRKDEEVDSWLIDLRNRLAAQKPSTIPAQTTSTQTTPNQNTANENSAPPAQTQQQNTVEADAVITETPESSDTSTEDAP